MRRALHANQIGMAEVCDRLGVQLATDQLAYYSHWITPKGMPKVFDTRFFIAQAPVGQAASHDTTETVHMLWLKPADALAQVKQGTLTMMNVTTPHARHLAGFDSAAAAVAWARAQTVVPLNRPRIGQGPKGRQPINIDHWAYAELGRLDPDGHCQASIELVPGKPVWLSPARAAGHRQQRSMMTGPGTNSYFIGAPGSDSWALLDPGPDDAEHIRALLDSAPGRITRILATHTHRDHSPAAAAIAVASGAAHLRPRGRVPGMAGHRLPTHPHAVRWRCAGVGRGRHAAGGAHARPCQQPPVLPAGGRKPAVHRRPPDAGQHRGHQPARRRHGAYLASLRRLLHIPLDWLAPGHGFLIDQPHAVVNKTIAHRLAREAKVLAAVQALGPARDDALLAQVYADTPKACMRWRFAHCGRTCTSWWSMVSSA